MVQPPSGEYALLFHFSRFVNASKSKLGEHMFYLSYGTPVLRNTRVFVHKTPATSWQTQFLMFRTRIHPKPEFCGWFLNVFENTGFASKDLMALRAFQDPTCLRCWKVLVNCWVVTPPRISLY